MIEDLKKSLDSVNTLSELNEVKAEYLGKKGYITSLYSKMRDLNGEEKKNFGAKINNLKADANSLLENKKNEIETKILNEKLINESIDISLPATEINIGAPSILKKMIEDIESLLMSMGYDVVDGPEVEKDEYNFEMLNLPKGHPARDAQDTFYVKGDELLLRSQNQFKLELCLLEKVRNQLG